MRARLQKHVDDGELLPWEPTILGDSCQRTLFITREINEEFDEGTWNDPAMAGRYAQLANDFDSFVAGEIITVGWEPYDKDDSAFMARVDPPEYGVWTIRSVAPRPGIRVFGGFADCDTFIAINTRIRKDLGGRGDRRWALARESAIEKWKYLFAPLPMKTGVSANDFISQKAIVV